MPYGQIPKANGNRPFIHPRESRRPAPAHPCATTMDKLTRTPDDPPRSKDDKWREQNE